MPQWVLRPPGAYWVPGFCGVTSQHPFPRCYPGDVTVDFEQFPIPPSLASGRPLYLPPNKPPPSYDLPALLSPSQGDRGMMGPPGAPGPKGSMVRNKWVLIALSRHWAGDSSVLFCLLLYTPSIQEDRLLLLPGGRAAAPVRRAGAGARAKPAGVEGGRVTCFTRFLLSHLSLPRVILELPVLWGPLESLDLR